MREVPHKSALAFVWGSEPLAFSIGYAEPLWPGDSGFTVLFDDAPDPEDVGPAGHPAVSWVCLHCLGDDHPELAPGLDIAREYGVAASTTTANGSSATSAGSIPRRSSSQGRAFRLRADV